MASHEELDALKTVVAAAPRTPGHLAAAEAARERTAWVVATAATAGVPYGAVAHLARQISPADHPDPGSLYRAYAASFHHHAGGASTVLGVDDAHLLDDGTASLLLHLVVARAATVIASLGRRQPAPDAITTLWKDGWAIRVDLQRLPDPDCSRCACREPRAAYEIVHRMLCDWSGGHRRGWSSYLR